MSNRKCELLGAAAIEGSELAAVLKPTRKEQSIGGCWNYTSSEMSGLLGESQFGAF
jgi:hypothetical protein